MSILRRLKRWFDTPWEDDNDRKLQESSDERLRRQAERINQDNPTLEHFYSTFQDTPEPPKKRRGRPRKQVMPKTDN